MNTPVTILTIKTNDLLFDPSFESILLSERNNEVRRGKSKGFNIVIDS